MFIGQFDLFYTCEILFYEKVTRQVHILKECSPLKIRSGLRDDWKACAAASYLTDLVNRISPARAHHPGLYHALDRALDHLARRGVRPAFLFWFELKLLQILGLEPRLAHCAQCNTVCRPFRHTAQFAYGRGGILCAVCASPDHPYTVPVAPDVLATLRGLQQARSAQVTIATHSTPRQLREMGAILGLFLQHHLEVELKSRAITLDVLRTDLRRSAN